MSFVTVSGIVRNLHITNGYEDLMIAKPNKDLVGLAAVYAASTGNNASASILSSSANGAKIEMEFFTCEVQEIQLKGKFYRVEFKEGESIDFVVTLKHGSREVQCARDVRQRLIWTLPYRNRGHIAQKRSDIIHNIAISSLSSALSTAVILHNNTLPFDKKIIEIAWLSIPVFLLSVFINYMTRKPFYKFSYDATEIFRTFKFNNPANVNLPKFNKKAQKEYAEEFGKNYLNEVPWKYRYRKIDVIF